MLMRSLSMYSIAALSLTLLASPASAQSADEIAAWLALVRSPIGGLVAAPTVGGIAAEQRTSIALNVGSWRFGAGDDETTNIGATMQFPRERVTVVLNGMLTSVQDCDGCGGLSIGGGFVYGLKQMPLGAAEGAQLDIALQPMANYGMWAEGEVSALTAAVSLPVSLSLRAGPITLRPFVTPGFAYGRASASSEAYGSTRTLLGYGLAIANRSGALQAHIGTMAVHLADAPSVTGAGITIRF
jgi:hypothetical protein